MVFLRKDSSVEKQINNVAVTVKAIENLRQRLFIKLLPKLYQEHAARTIYCDGLVWVVVTKEKEILPKIGRVLLDNAADTGDHIKIFDEQDNLMEVPKDIVVLYSGAGSHPNVVEDIIKSAE